MCELPDVKFENFVAAKACLQSTLSLIGGVVERISIRQDQNGRAVWRVTLNGSGNFPTPDPSNFIAIRAVLNRHIPKRGVLRTINLEVDMSPTQTWRWEVCYGIKKTSRIRQAIKSLKNVITTVTPCLQGTAETTQLRRQVNSLEKLEKTKNDRRFFYQLRKKKGKTATAAVEPKPAPRPTRTQPQKSRPTGFKSDSDALSRAKKYDFIKGETIPGSAPEKKETSGSSTNVAPEYNEWEIKNILYGMKRIEYEFIVALRTIMTCDCKKMYPSFAAQSRYAWAVLTVRTYSERITAQNIKRVYEAALERAGISDEFVSTFTIPKIESRITISQRPSDAVHVMCH